MGRGDKRTKRGKISMGSFGKSRLARATKKTKAAKKA
jgi:30S ribosomal protein S31